MRFLVSIILLLTLLFIGVGCSNDDESPTNPGDDKTGTASTTWDGGGSFWITELDATSYDDFVYYDFDTRDIVELTAEEAAQSTVWDLAFQRSVIKTNGGDSGPGSASGVNLNEHSVSKTLTAVTSADLSGLSAGDWIEDGRELVIDNYYQYNPQTHQLTMTGVVYAMIDAEGKYLKMRIADLIGGGAPPAMGNFVIQYVHAASGSDLSGTVVEDTVDGSTGEFYYDFSTGSAVTPANPSTSMDWDIKVSSYDIYLNSSFSGSGQAAANQANWLVSMADSTDMEEYTTAITVPQAYSKDVEGSVFTNWYDYNGDTHRLTSKGHIFVVDAGGKRYAMEIITWYGETGISGNYIINWKEL